MPGFARATVKINNKKLSQLTADAYNKVIKKINRQVPRIFKEELSASMMSDPTGRLQKYASTVGGVKTVYSDIGLAQKSTGVRAKIIDNELVLRFTFTKSTGGVGMYWQLLMAKGGRKEINSNKAMPIHLKRMKDGTRSGRKPKKDPLNPGMWLIFTKKVKAMPAWHDWDEEAIKNTKRRVKELVRKI